MNDNKQQATKFFTVVVEGATTDGRDVSKEWITQMAQNYDPKVYCAQVNIEHIRAYSPDSTFRRYGTVTALRTHLINEGALQGKLALQAQINPTPALIELNKAKQKLFASVEIAPEFADTKSAYLIGLAVTDDPASLGTEILRFSSTAVNNPFVRRKLNKENLFSASDFELNIVDLEQSVSFDRRLHDFKNILGTLFNSKKDATWDEIKNSFQTLITTVKDLIAFNGDLLDTLHNQQAQLDALTKLNQAEQEEKDHLNACSARPPATGAALPGAVGY